MLQAGLKSLEEAATQPIVAYWHKRWSDADFKLLKVRKGEPSGQAALEAFTLLISVATWSKVLSQAIAGELAHLVSPLGLDIRAAHVWSERNEICDQLSRMKDGEECTRPELQQAVRVKRLKTPRFWLSNLA